MEPTPEPGVTGTVAFTVAHAHTTNVFGSQHAPPGLPAAEEADEAVAVLGTPHLLARFEFVGRESIRGSIPDGTGVVGEQADVRHERPVPVGVRVRVETEVVAVDGRSCRFEGRAVRLDTDRRVAEGSVTLRIVDRDRFRASLG